MTAVEDLKDAADEYASVKADVESVGRDTLATVCESYREITRLMDRYEERATDWDDFEGYVEFQSAIVDFVEGLPDDHPERSAFEAVDERFHQRSLSDRDFERAREDLAPVREYVALQERFEAARERYTDARYAVRRQRDEIDEEIDHLERLQGFTGCDFDAPTERLSEPIERYNETVRAAFRTFVHEESARAVLSLLATTRFYPLVEYRRPPSDLSEFVTSHEAGTETIPTLLEYASYSRSKLDHYVADPAALCAAVETNRTYLSGLDGGPLEIAWPPPQAETLRFQIRERIAVVDRFTDESDSIAQLRELRAMSRNPEYERLHESAHAREELDDDERERIQSGSVERDLEDARAERSRLTEVLREYPGPRM